MTNINKLGARNGEIRRSIRFFAIDAIILYLDCKLRW